jgi:hypothetical protein
MRALDANDSAVTTAYVNSLDSGGTQVWAGTLNIYPGWVDIVLDEPFFLPAGKNLEIINHNQHGSSLAFNYGWENTAYIGYYATSFGRSNTSFAASLLTGWVSTGYVARPNLKITTNDAVASYGGIDLALIAIHSPINSLDNLCLPDYSPATIIIQNRGESDYDFTKDSIRLHFEIAGPMSINYSETITVDSGILKSREKNLFEIIPSIPLMYAGDYQIKTWIESSIDNNVYDDTIFYTYRSGRIILPIEDDFSSGVISDQFISVPVVGTEAWAPYTDPTSTITPPAGGGMLRYVGLPGTMTRITSRQIELFRVLDPEVNFWYYHDALASENDYSYTEVNIVVDGVINNELTLFRKGNTTGWVHYVIDLTDYANAQCVLVQFETMNKYDLLSAQYLSFITITSTPELAVSSIVISPEIAACGLKNSDLNVVLTTNMNQIVDFSRDTTSLIVETPDSTFVVPLQGIIAGNSSDTILITSNFPIPTGVHTISAYLRTPVDDYSANDTIVRVLDIRPALSVTINPVTNANACAKKGAEVGQEIVLRNTGNIDIPEMELLLLIDVTPPQIIRESISTPLLAGDTLRYTFNNMYTVPAEVDYPVRVLVWMKCDSALINNLFEVQECVDLHNIAIASLDNPPIDRIDVAGSTENIIVTLKNESYLRRYANVSVTAMIEDENGQMLNSRVSILSNIEPLDSALLTFTEPYTVPNDSVYYIKVFLNSLDIYPEDDTLKIKRYTETVGISSIKENNAFALGQNIPNPAGNSTRIDYSIPEAEKVIFHVQSVSGQLLYSKTIEAASGKHSLELNTNTLSAGIYFYSIEYKGQRLIKRMSVQK